MRAGGADGGPAGPAAAGRRAGGDLGGGDAEAPPARAPLRTSPGLAAAALLAALVAAGSAAGHGEAPDAISFASACGGERSDSLRGALALDFAAGPGDALRVSVRGASRPARAPDARPAQGSETTLEVRAAGAVGPCLVELDVDLAQTWERVFVGSSAPDGPTPYEIVVALDGALRCGRGLTCDAFVQVELEQRGTAAAPGTARVAIDGERSALGFEDRLALTADDAPSGRALAVAGTLRRRGHATGERLELVAHLFTRAHLPAQRAASPAALATAFADGLEVHVESLDPRVAFRPIARAEN